jgi:GNAT superfamily N-acetyltransferase
VESRENLALVTAERQTRTFDGNEFVVTDSENLEMPVTSFCKSHNESVLSLRDATFASTNLSRFTWQPCQQVESLDRQCIKFVFADGDVKGYVSAYQLDDTHFRLNLIVDPSHSRKGIGSQLLKRIEQEVVRDQGKYLQARVLESMPASLSFALVRGFTQIHTMRGMALNASDFLVWEMERVGAKTVR